MTFNDLCSHICLFLNCAFILLAFIESVYQNRFRNKEYRKKICSYQYHHSIRNFVKCFKYKAEYKNIKYKIMGVTMH